MSKQQFNLERMIAASRQRDRRRREKLLFGRRRTTIRRPIVEQVGKCPSGALAIGK